MAITDLTNTTWYFNDSVQIYSTTMQHGDYNINFSCNNVTYTFIQAYWWYYFEDGRGHGEHYLRYGSTTVLEGTLGDTSPASNWVSDAYRTITITGGQHATNTDLIAWLQDNAVQQVVYSKEYKYYPKADLTAIADAIRSVKGTSTSYTIDQMIEALAGGG